MKTKKVKKGKKISKTSLDKIKGGAVGSASTSLRVRIP